MYPATWSVIISGRSERVDLISASALAFTLASTGTAASLASSIGAGSDFCSVNPSPCCRACISKPLIPSRMRSNSLSRRGSELISRLLLSSRSKAWSKF